MPDNRHLPLPQQTVARPGMPHPATLILLWLMFAIGLQTLHAGALIATGALAAAIALKLFAARFLTLLRRTRWIMLSLLLIYGYATPGAALWVAAGTLGPTQEGLVNGALQLGRLVTALAALSAMLSLLSRQQLVSGIYALAAPLRLLGLSRERIAVRLALTLHYAETAMLDTTSGWRARIAGMLQPQPVAQHEIELHAAPLELRDLLLIATGCALLALAWI